MTADPAGPVGDQNSDPVNAPATAAGDPGTPRPGPAPHEGVEVTVTYDTSLAPHKSGSEKLYLMRNAADPDGPVLAFTEAEWEAFILGVKDGEFDLP